MKTILLIATSVFVVCAYAESLRGNTDHAQLIMLGAILTAILRRPA